MPKIGNPKPTPHFPTTAYPKDKQTRQSFQSIREVIAMSAEVPEQRHASPIKESGYNPLCVFCRHNLCCRLWRDGRKKCHSFELSIF